MARLTKLQVDYAKKRLNTYSKNKKEDIRKKYTSGDYLTDEVRYNLLKKGKVPIKKEVTAIRAYSSVRDVFDFSSLEPKLDKKRYDKEASDVDAEVEGLMDSLILGDTDEALAIINKLKG